MKKIKVLTNLDKELFIVYIDGINVNSIVNLKNCIGHINYINESNIKYNDKIAFDYIYKYLHIDDWVKQYYNKNGNLDNYENLLITYIKSDLKLFTTTVDFTKYIE